jgi:HlyD family secretion protein
MDPQVYDVDLQRHSAEANDILKKTPPRFAQWGGTISLLLVFIALIMAWFIKYPDIIVSSFKLTAYNLPRPVYSKEKTRIIGLYVKENQSVTQDQVVGLLESGASFHKVQEAKKYLMGVEGNLQRQIPAEWPKIASVAGLGEVQASYQEFITSYEQFLACQAHGFYKQKLLLHQNELNQLKLLEKNAGEQLATIEKDLTISLDYYNTQKNLFSQKVIPKVDFQKEESRLLAKTLEIQQAEASIISIKNQQAVKLQEILEVKNKISTFQISFYESVQNLHRDLQNWDKKFVLRSPISGLVNFNYYLEAGQVITNDRAVLYINPKRGTAFGEVYVSQNSFGKIKLGQIVIIKFDAYPNDEFGIVEGKVDFISEIPDDNNHFLVKVLLPKGLITNYNKRLFYRVGMQASAEIITDNARLLERMMKPFYSRIMKQRI